jgi:hypothetical protein
MRELKHDDIMPGADLQTQGGAHSEKTIRLFVLWLWRAIGRRCATGLWTLSPDGKLHCESLRAKTRHTD